MSEYQESHTVSSLKGAPPGYVGYGEGGVLTEAVRRKPYSVILLDEIEKAHPDIHEVFFQVFDKGWMEDGEGRYIDFKNTTLLLTSNVGSELITQLYADPQSAPDHEGLLEALQPELLKAFPPAFVGRLEVVPYIPLQHASLLAIIELHLNKIAQRLDDHYGIRLQYETPVMEAIINHCAIEQTGARALIQFIEKYITPQIGRYVLQHKAAIPQQVLYLNCEAEKQFSVTF